MLMSDLIIELDRYKNDRRIAAMTDLVDAYQRDDIHRYESILQSNKDLLEDPFIAENIDEVTRNMRTKAIIKIVAPYTRFTLASVAKQLLISVPEVQEILGFLIVDKKVLGKINQENGMVVVEGKHDVERMESVRALSSAIGSLSTIILDQGDGFRPDESNQSLGDYSAGYTSSMFHESMAPPFRHAAMGAHKSGSPALAGMGGSAGGKSKRPGMKSIAVPK